MKIIDTEENIRIDNRRTGKSTYFFKLKIMYNEIEYLFWFSIKFMVVKYLKDEIYLDYELYSQDNPENYNKITEYKIYKKSEKRIKFKIASLLTSSNIFLRNFSRNLIINNTLPQNILDHFKKSFKIKDNE